MSSSKQSKRSKHITPHTIPDYIPTPGWNIHGTTADSPFRLPTATTTATTTTTHSTPSYYNDDDDNDNVVVATHEQVHPSGTRIIHSDNPPDYSDGAEEADNESDTVNDTDTDTHVLVKHRIPQHHHHHHHRSASFSPRALNRFNKVGSPPALSKRSKRILPSLPPTPVSITHRRRHSRSIPQVASLTPPELSPASPTDPYLDSLLERSVHALEMSNTLLQSSVITTQTGLTGFPSAGDSRGLLSSGRETRRVSQDNNEDDDDDDWGPRPPWADDLAEIKRGVDGLFGREGTTTTTTTAIPTPSSATEAGSPECDKMDRMLEHLAVTGSSTPPTSDIISCSLPTTWWSSSNYNNSSRRRWGDDSSSLDYYHHHEEPSSVPNHNNNSKTTGLHFARQSRDDLISPPPRPITQYTPSVLPSTIGIRTEPPNSSPSSIYLAPPQWRSSSTTIPSLSTPSLPPQLTDKPLEPSTPAYNMLSSFVNRQPTSSSGTNTPSTSFTTSFMASIHRSNDNKRCPGAAKRRSSSDSPSRFRECTPRLRVMTPPVEELTPPPSSSSSSNEGCMAKRTVLSLRRILDDQPPLEARTAILGLTGDRLKAPKFMPKTPVAIPEASTSNATASISRLFTKGTHSSSTRAPSPPRQSAMKHSRNNSSSSVPNALQSLPLPLPPPHSTTTEAAAAAAPVEQTPMNMMLNIPEMISKVLLSRRNGTTAGGLGSGAATSTSSSGYSTPTKRISFAELPESYASTRPGGVGASKFKEKHNNRRKRKGKQQQQQEQQQEQGQHYYGWDNNGPYGGLESSMARWWPGGGGGGGGGATEYEGLGGLSSSFSRREDRITGGWGRPGMGFA